MAKDFMTINPTAARALAQKSSVGLVAQATAKVTMHAKLLAPGTMKDHIRPIVSPTLGIVVCDHPATSFVLHGTPPHVIAAKRGKFLKFEAGGQLIFRHSVNHPGFKGNNFLLKALEASRIF